MPWVQMGAMVADSRYLTSTYVGKDEELGFHLQSLVFLPSYHKGVGEHLFSLTDISEYPHWFVLL